MKARAKNVVQEQQRRVLVPGSFVLHKQNEVLESLSFKAGRSSRHYSALFSSQV